jgi:hypothetical protein
MDKHTTRIIYNKSSYAVFILILMSFSLAACTPVLSSNNSTDVKNNSTTLETSFIIAKTSLNNSIELHRYAKVTNFTNNTTKINIFYIANQHGDETKSSVIAKGFEAAIINNTAYQERFNTWIIPVANPDGQKLNMHTNYNNQNTNRCWNSSECYETNQIKSAIDNIENITLFIDNHALVSGENYSYIYLRTKENLSDSQKEGICNALNVYLAAFKCNIEQVNGETNQDIAGYYMTNKARFSILIEVSQAYTSNETAIQMGENLTKFISAII